MSESYLLARVRTMFAENGCEDNIENRQLLIEVIRDDWAFVTAVGQRVERRKTAENVHGTLGSILNLGRKWGYEIPRVEKRDIVFPADKKPQPQIFFFDADTAARVINARCTPTNSCSSWPRCAASA